jgi:hypothetical protein
MSSENIDPRKLKLKQNEADFANTNFEMQDRIKLDNQFGRLESKEKPLKPVKKMIGP